MRWRIIVEIDDWIYCSWIRNIIGEKDNVVLDRISRNAQNREQLKYQFIGVALNAILVVWQSE